MLNRFLMQAAIGHPMTIHGTGGQTRAFIHITDTVKCVQLAIENPPAAGEPVQIMNQMTECHRLRELAAKIQAVLPDAEIAKLQKQVATLDPLISKLRSKSDDPAYQANAPANQKLADADKLKQYTERRDVAHDAIAMWQKTKQAFGGAPPS